MAGTKTPLAPPAPIEITKIDTSADLHSRVIVFNCECHTYEQVIALFCQYIPGMSSAKAFELAWKIDHDGEAIVFAGPLEQAEEIAAKLAGGGLRVAVQ
jgi:ATP-dependent Clp protease adaptor protein ClpS